MTGPSSPEFRRTPSYEGPATKDVADLLGMTPAAVEMAVKSLRDDGKMRSSDDTARGPEPASDDIAPALARAKIRRERARERVEERELAEELQDDGSDDPAEGLGAPQPDVRDVLQLVGGLHRAGYSLPVPGALAGRAADMDCPGCERHGLLSKALRMRRTDVVREIAYCRHCRAAVEIDSAAPSGAGA